MQIPAAMFIESGLDSLANVEMHWLDDQQKELTSFGDTRAQRMGATGLSNDFRKGYELGLQTARTMLLRSVKLAIAKINPEEVL